LVVAIGALVRQVEFDGARLCGVRGGSDEEHASEVTAGAGHAFPRGERFTNNSGQILELQSIGGKLDVNDVYRDGLESA
jgi:hypothetical protein